MTLTNVKPTVLVGDPQTSFLSFVFRFAWTSPSSLEPWIEKRLTPLSKDTVPHTPVDKLIGTKHIPDDILDSHNESFKAKQG